MGNMKKIELLFFYVGKPDVNFHPEDYLDGIISFRKFNFSIEV